MLVFLVLCLDKNTKLENEIQDETYISAIFGLSESAKIHSPMARVFPAFQKSRSIPRAWITLTEQKLTEENNI